MYELKEIGKVLTSKSVGTGPSSYEKRIYQAAVSQRLRNTDVSDVSPAVALLVAGTRTTDFVWKKAHYNQRSATSTLVLNAPNQWFALPCCYVWRYKHDQVKGQLVTQSQIQVTTAAVGAPLSAAAVCRWTPVSIARLPLCIHCRPHMQC